MPPIIKPRCRRYGGALEVTTPFPPTFDFQLVDIQVVDKVNEISDYNTTFLTSNEMLETARADDPLGASIYSHVNTSEAQLFGRTSEGFSVCVRVPYRPYLFAALPTSITLLSQCPPIAEKIAELLHLEPDDVQFEVKKKPRLYGWVPDPKNPLETEKIPIMRISVPNMEKYRALIALLKKRQGLDVEGFTKRLHLSAWETKVDHIAKFCDQTNIVASGWIRVKSYSNVAGYVSHSQIECASIIGDIEPLDRSDLAPLLVASVDGEMYSRRHVFPDATQKEDYVIAIGTVLWRTGRKITIERSKDDMEKELNGKIAELEEQLEMIRTPPSKIEEEKKRFESTAVIDSVKKVCEMERFIFVLGTCQEVKNATVFNYQTEAELLDGWRDFIAVHADPDIITGYNIWGFDWKYLHDRARQVYRQHPQAQLETQGPSPNFNEISVLPGNRVEDQEFRQLEDEFQRALQSQNNSRKNCEEVKRDIVSDMVEREIDESIENSDDGGGGNKRTVNIKPIVGDNNDNDYKEDNEDNDDNENKDNDKDNKQQSDPNSRSAPEDCRFFYCSRTWARPSDLDAKTFASSAYGESYNYHFHMWGRVTIDLLVFVKREHKLESYKLDFISHKFLRDNKIDLPAKLMMKYFELGAAKRTLIAEYCLKDCELPIALLDYFVAIPNLVGMSRITYTQLTQILERGQQIKVFNQLVWNAHRLGYVLNDPPKGTCDEFEGATVIEPKTGFYKWPVATLDFQSLYPSIIRDQNICYSTYIVDKNNPLIKKLPADKINKITLSDREHWFVNHTKGVLPVMEESLLKARKAVRKEMEKAKGDLKQMLNGKQLAIKVSCNSIFGFAGAERGLYTCKPIAESITARGRFMIEKTRKTVLEMYPNTEVIYGDSVVGDTPLLLRETLPASSSSSSSSQRICCWSIENLWKRFAKCSDEVSHHISHHKQYVDIPEDVLLESWTESGWTRVFRIMRHQTDKNLIQVLTPNAAIIVTEDHSLLDEEGREISPRDVKPGTSLYHSFPAFNGCRSNLLPTMTDPNDILNASNEQQLEYFHRLRIQQNKRYNESNILYFDSAEEALRMYTLAQMLKLSCTVDMALGTYILVLKDGDSKDGNDSKDTFDLNKVSRLSKLPSSKTRRFVYDLTTENHHFHAGFGKLIVHNTDSVMVMTQNSPDLEGIKATFDMGFAISKKVSSLFSEAVGLEMEKVYCPYLLFGKKRYVGLKFEEADKPKCLDAKGLEVVRRDSSLLTRHVFKKMLKKIIFESDPKGAVQVLRDDIQRVINDELPLEMFIKSQSLKGSYANPTGLPHVAVVNKIRSRAPGTEPKVGDRVPYVIIYNPKAQKISEKSEDPDWVRRHNVPLDKRYYVENQLQSPLTKVLIPFVTNESQVDLLFAPYLALIDSKAIGMKSLLDYENINVASNTQSNTLPMDIDCLDATATMPTNDFVIRDSATQAQHQSKSAEKKRVLSNMSTLTGEKIPTSETTKKKKVTKIKKSNVVTGTLM